MEDEAIEKRYVDSLLDNQVMGMILVSASMKSHPRIVRENTPVVFVDRVGVDLAIPNRVVIESDNEKGGALAAEQLLKRGVQRFVFLGDQRNMQAMRNRERGFAEYLRDNAVAPAHYHRDYMPVSAPEARAKARTLYETFPFDGLFCGTDTLALGAMRGLLGGFMLDARGGVSFMLTVGLGVSLVGLVLVLLLTAGPKQRQAASIQYS